MAPAKTKPERPDADLGEPGFGGDPRADTSNMKEDAVLADAADKTATAAKPKLKNIDDLRRLNRRATQEGLYGGILGGGALAYGASRLGVGKNGMTLTLLLAAPVISYGISRARIRAELGEHVEAMRSLREPAAPDGGGAYFVDRVATGDAAPRPEDEISPRPEDLRAKLAAEFAHVAPITEPRARTRWTKGQGLDGEVEEEPEMRDTWLRPGVPRREV